MSSRSFITKRIIYTTTGVQVRPYKKEALAPIMKSRSAWDPVRHKYNPITAYSMECGEDKEKVFLTYNCDRTYIQELLPGYIMEELGPNHVEPISESFELNDDIIPTNLQSDAIKVVLENKFAQAFFNIPTGVGKTLMSLYLVSLLQSKTWIMCFSVEVLKQWVKTLREKTTFNLDKILMVSSSSTMRKILSGKIDPSEYDIFMSTPGILTKFAEKEGPDALYDLFDICGIGMKIFDEANRNIANITKINAITSVERTYYLSADFSQSGKTKRTLYYRMFHNIPIIKPSEEKKKEMRHINAVVVHYNSHPTYLEQESAYGKYGFSAHNYMEYQITNPTFWDTFKAVIDTIHEQNAERNKILILLNMIDHVDATKAWLDEMNLKGCVVGRFHSRMPDDEKEETLLNANVIVSTYQSMGVGLDIFGIQYVIAVAPFSPIEDNQAAGRARPLPSGKDCFYFIMCDDGFEYNVSRIRDRLSYLQTQKVKKIYAVYY